MALGSKTHINSLLKEYWLDVAGSTTAKSLNDAMRAGLTALGFSGSIGKMLKASISVALKNAMADMVGETVSDVTAGLKEYMGQINWNALLVKFEDEDRQWSYID